MKTKVLFTILSVVLHFGANGQSTGWSVSGNDIYNPNSGNVGIGTGSTVPDAKLYVKSTSSTAIISIFSKQGGTEQLGFGLYGYLPTPTSNTYLKNTLMLYGSGVSLTHMNISNAATNGTIRFLTGGWDSQSFQRMIITSSGNIGIGTSNPSPTYLLDVNGGVRAFFVDQTSDERFKQDIKKITGSLDKISQIAGYSYFFNTDKFKDKNFPSGEQMGVLAQEIQKIFPNSVREDAEGYLSVNYISLIPVMIQAIKELKTQLDQTRANQLASTLLANDVRDVEMYRGAYLNQNAPNPFSSKTSIEYTVPDNAYTANIIVHDLSGKQIKRMEITDKGTGSIDIASENLTPGFYLYSLVLDGKPILTKKMILSY